MQRAQQRAAVNKPSARTWEYKAGALARSLSHIDDSISSNISPRSVLACALAPSRTLPSLPLPLRFALTSDAVFVRLRWSRRRLRELNCTI